MPTVCAAKKCGRQNVPTRKGCGGRQKVQAEYVRYAKELLKDSAAEGDWICMTCRDALKARASTFGVAVSDDAQVLAAGRRRNKRGRQHRASAAAADAGDGDDDSDDSDYLTDSGEEKDESTSTDESVESGSDESDGMNDAGAASVLASMNDDKRDSMASSVMMSDQTPPSSTDYSIYVYSSIVTVAPSP